MTHVTEPNSKSVVFFRGITGLLGLVTLYLLITGQTETLLLSFLLTVFVGGTTALVEYWYS